jgi:hypothetical protein
MRAVPLPPRQLLDLTSSTTPQKHTQANKEYNDFKEQNSSDEYSLERERERENKTEEFNNNENDEKNTKITIPEIVNKTKGSITPLFRKRHIIKGFVHEAQFYHYLLYINCEQQRITTEKERQQRIEMAKQRRLWTPPICYERLLKRGLATIEPLTTTTTTTTTTHNHSYHKRKNKQTTDNSEHTPMSNNDRNSLENENTTDNRNIHNKNTSLREEDSINKNNNNNSSEDYCHCQANKINEPNCIISTNNSSFPNNVLL